jgi:hypothetical protein
VLVAVFAVVGLAMMSSSATAALTWSSPVQIATGSSASLSAPSCPLTTQCTAVYGSRAVTYNPTAPSGAKLGYVGTGLELKAVACPAAGACAAVSSDGREVTFNPQTFAVGASAVLQSGSDFLGVACFDASHCAAVSGGAYIASFDPANPVAATTTQILPAVLGDPIDPLEGVACPGLHQCDAVADSGHVVAFDPADLSSASAVSVDPSGASPTAIACSSASLCTLLDDLGNAYSFSASTPGTPTPTTATYDTGVVSGLTCPAADVCVAADGSDGAELKFDPETLAPATEHVVDSASGLQGIACTSATACTATDGAGAAVTAFDPASPGTPAVTQIDAADWVTGIACVPSGGTCTAVDRSGKEWTFDPDNPGSSHGATLTGSALDAVACPAANECVAGAGSGGAIVFNPAAPVAPVPIPVLGGISSIACASTTQCVATDGTSQLRTLNPTDGATGPVVTTTNFMEIDGISCATTDRCVIVGADSTPAGVVAAFDPTNAGSPVGAVIGSAYWLTSVSCPTISQCTAADGRQGRSYTFNPGSPGTPASVTAPQSAHISCAAASFCVLGGTGVVEGNPTASSWSNDTATIGVADGVACNQAGRCVILDATGGAIVGVAAPVNSSPPTISGTAAQGQTLTESHGGWANTPTAYAIQWESCDASGNGCAAISGATGPTYVPVAGDVGHTLRVTETASDVAGSAGPVSSAQTAVVVATHGGGGGSGPTAAQIKALLVSEIAPHGKSAAIGALRAAGRYPANVRALEAGRLVISWYFLPKGAHFPSEDANRRPKPILIASGTVSFRSAASAKITIKLTRAGTAMLKRSRKLKLTGTGSFIPAGGSAVTAQASFTLKP